MNLHHDHEAFSELIIAASNELHIPPGIIVVVAGRFSRTAWEPTVTVRPFVDSFDVTISSVAGIWVVRPI